MKTIKLYLDFLNGPIWKDVYDVKNDVLITGIKIIDTDPVLQELDKSVQETYSSFYSFNKSGEGSIFDEEAFKASKESLFASIDKIKTRLDEINDGSFVVVDYISTEKDTP